MQKKLLIVLMSLVMLTVKGQDSLHILHKTNNEGRLFSAGSVGFSAACIGYGVGSLNNSRLKNWNKQVNTELAVKDPALRVKIDDYLVYSPGLLTIGLHFAGIKSQHDWKESLLFYAITNATVTAIVVPVKYISKEQRPDQSSYNSFPSGHTSMAFASAEFARMEFRDHPWVGVLSYCMATATGYLRMYNNRHWLGDVVAGAGIGILSAKCSLWLMERSKKYLTNKTRRNYR